MTSPADRTIKKYIEIAEKIRSDIENGVYKEGGRIPPIRKLAETYDANPQTVNKATAYLASLGFLVPRQGSGSVVRIPVGAVRPRGIAMLIDRSRSRLLADLDDMANYHGKDIYLTYLMEMSRRDAPSGFLVYDRDETAPCEEFRSQASRTQGFIVQGTLPDAYLEELVHRNIPAVFINRRLPAVYGGRFASIVISLEQIPIMMNYLLSLGHQKILYLLSDEFEENDVFAERFELASNALSAWNAGGGTELRIFRFRTGDSESRRELSSLLSEGFSAGFGYNDASALSFYPLLHQCGLHIPQDFSVVGFDDITVSKIAAPPLTTIRVNRQRLVHQAFLLLDRLSAGENGARLEECLPSEFVIRSSAFVRK